MHATAPTATHLIIGDLRQVAGDQVFHGERFDAANPARFAHADDRRHPVDVSVLEPGRVFAKKLDNWLDLAAAIRAVVSVPVIAAGRLGHAAVAERAIAAIAESERGDPALRIFFAHDPAKVRAQAEDLSQANTASTTSGPVSVIKALITHPIVPNLKDAKDVLNLLKYSVHNRIIAYSRKVPFQ